MRCVRTNSANSGSCDRCIQAGRSCCIPQAQKLGRKRGSGGRYQGVDKALRALQLALKKSEGQQTPERSRIISVVSEILHDENLTVSHESSKGTPSQQTSLVTLSSCDSSDWTTAASTEAELPCALENGGLPNAQDASAARLGPYNQPNNKSNALWLIADASREALATMASYPQSPTLINQEASHLNEHAQSPSENCLKQSRQLLNRSACVPFGLKLESWVLEEGLDALLTMPHQQTRTLDYFKSRDLHHFPDTGPDLDPIEQGLLTIQEAEKLFPMSILNPSFRDYH